MAKLSKHNKEKIIHEFKMMKEMELSARDLYTKISDLPDAEQQLKITFAKMAQDRKIPLLAGILLLRTPAMARYVEERVSGVRIPERLIAELENSKDSIKTGIEIAARIIGEARDLCQGVHIMTGGREDLVRQVLDKAGVRRSAS